MATSPEQVKEEDIEGVLVTILLWSFSTFSSYFSHHQQQKPHYQQIHPLHFEELSKIWDSDRRIPSVISRRAWAEARHLNPTNVHSWWYRRRPVARKLKVKIPRDEYELDVGVPPVIPLKEADSSDTPASRRDDDNLSTDAWLSSPHAPFSDSDGLVPASSETCLSNHDLEFKNSLFEELSAEMSAYMRSSSPAQPSLDPLLTTLSASPSRESSPLPSSSPPRSPLPQDLCLLKLPKDIVVDGEDADPSQPSSDSDWLSEGIFSC